MSHDHTAYKTLKCCIFKSNKIDVECMPNTQRQESTIRARECQCQFWPSFAFHIDPQYEKLKFESGLGLC